jgi:hypothetical protein
MQRIDVTISGTGGEPLMLAFAATDSADVIAERLRTIVWLVRQLDGHAPEPRRRGPRQDRAIATSPEPPVES